MSGSAQDVLNFHGTRIQRRFITIDPTGDVQDSIRTSLLDFIDRSPEDLDYGVYYSPPSDQPWLQKVLCNDCRLGTAVYLNTTVIRHLGITVDIFGYRGLIYFLTSTGYKCSDDSLDNSFNGEDIYSCSLDNDLLQKLAELFEYHKQPVFLWHDSILDSNNPGSCYLPLRMIDIEGVNRRKDPLIDDVVEVMDDFVANYNGGVVYRGTLTSFCGHGQHVKIYAAGYLGSVHDYHWWYRADTIFVTDSNLTVLAYKHPRLLLPLLQLEVLDEIAEIIPAM